MSFLDGPDVLAGSDGTLPPHTSAYRLFREDFIRALVNRSKGVPPNFVHHLGAPNLPTVDLIGKIIGAAPAERLRELPGDLVVELRVLVRNDPQFANLCGAKLSGLDL